MSSLLSRESELARSAEQVNLLENPNFKLKQPRFAEKLKQTNLLPLKPTKLEIFQINVGKMCNQTCHHCHVDAGPDRKEIMTRETMQACVDIVKKHKFSKVDLTGGAPEMNPNFRWFVTELKAAGAHIIVRCNLTIITANEKYRSLPEFFRENKIEVVSSLPHYTKGKTDRQRGDGVFERSIKALKMLNDVGYGVAGSGLELNLVYNPAGAFLPGDQSQLERDFKQKLKADFEIQFNNLFAITNLPISRYLEFLIKSDNYEKYMQTLIEAYNPKAAEAVMCRNTISVGWDGQLYDCDFNQMLDLNVEKRAPQHIKDFDMARLEARNIVIGQHCYGCTAGSGSSCGGATS
jgi:radical SAM/Cys-rich protein